MSWCNAISTLISCRTQQPINSKSKITIEVAPQTRCAKATRWLCRAITYPFTVVPHGLYNIYLFATRQELHEPVAKNVYSGNTINYMPVLGQTHFHIVSSPEVMHAITQHPRNDPKGVFQGKVIANVMLPLLRDVFQQPVDDEDFLLTCSKETTESLRKPILDFIGPQIVHRLRPQLEEVVMDVMAIIKQKEVEGVVKIKAKDLTEMFTVGVISKLLLGHPGPYEVYQKIGHAITLALHYQLIIEHRKPTTKQKADYQIALELIRSTIASSKGPFFDSLKASGMSELRIKALFLLLYIGGSETSSSLLQYLLWLLGKHLGCQKALFEESRGIAGDGLPTICTRRPKMKAFTLEGLRLYTPADLFSRYAREDLIITVTNKGKGCRKKWTYCVPKGHGLLSSPFLAGRDPKTFLNPHQFNLERYPSGDHPLHLWKPLSEGLHSCPGKSIAFTEIPAFLTAMIGTYHIVSTPNKSELTMKGFITLGIADTVELTLTRRTDPIVFAKSSYEDDSKEAMPKC